MAPQVTVKGLVVGYPGRPCSRPIDLCWGPGTHLIRGPNGCGKSTLLRTLAGMIRPRAGRVVIQGIDLARDPVGAKRLMGYAPDQVPLPPTAAAGELFRLVGWAHGRADDLGRSPCALRLAVADFLDRPVAELSLGQRRRLVLAAALALEAPVLLLDEPTVGLDVTGIAILTHLVNARSQAGQLTLCVTHESWTAGLQGAHSQGWEEQFALPGPA